MSRWLNFNVMGRDLPVVAGTYVIYFDGDLVYVGSSRNVRNRFSEHKFRPGFARNIITPWQDVPDTTKITIKVKPSRRLGDWAMDEIRLIHRLRPLFNTHHMGRKKAA